LLEDFINSIEGIRYHFQSFSDSYTLGWSY